MLSRLAPPLFKAFRTRQKDGRMVNDIVLITEARLVPTGSAARRRSAGGTLPGADLKECVCTETKGSPDHLAGFDHNPRFLLRQAARTLPSNVQPFLRVRPNQGCLPKPGGQRFLPSRDFRQTFGSARPSPSQIHLPSLNGERKFLV